MNSETIEKIAQQYALAGPYSVTHKAKLEFSSDPHDYVSGRLYWWKENNKYVRKDGEPNPVYRGPDFDRQRLEDLINAVVCFTLLYALENNPKYIKQAGEYLKVWFIDPSTRMNPNLEHSQIVPGEDQNGLGIIDTYNFIYLLDSVDYLYANQLIASDIYMDLQKWFKAYALWLRKSKLGKLEASRTNNHASSIDVQISRYLIFTRQELKARFFLKRKLKKHFKKQITDEGLQPEESNRVNSLYYHWYNLAKLNHLYDLGLRLNIQNPKHREKLNKALSFLLPFLAQPERSPLKQQSTLYDHDIVEVMLGIVVRDSSDFSMDKAKQYLETKNSFTHYFQVKGVTPPPSLIKKIIPIDL